MSHVFLIMLKVRRIMPTKIEGFCSVCEQRNARYRCPKCTIVYCTVPCYKQHKEQCVVVGVRDITCVEEPKCPSLDLKGNEDYVKLEALKKLEHSDSLKTLLSNKHLRDMLSDIDASPDKLLEEAMHVPIFTEFADQCLTIVEPPDSLNVT